MIAKLFNRPVCAILRISTRFKATEANNYVVAKEVGDKGILTLNRPNALNAINIDMLKILAATIQKWSDTKSLIIVKGLPGIAFSAGGDLIGFDVNKDNPNYGREVWQTELVMNHTIANMKIPYVALIDGVTMGGGVGISVYAKYCIATENTLFAMPESAIGLFPDVGASYFFSRLQGKLGYYLGLTGLYFALKEFLLSTSAYVPLGQDVLHAGLATHYCRSAELQKMEKALLKLKDTKHVDDVINEFCPKPNSEFSLSKNIDQIDKCFNASSVEEILDNLEKDNSEWAKQTTKTLRQLCPTSVKIMFRNLQLGSNQSFAECLQMEYRVVLRVIAGKNFIEGCRALLIRKDKNPKWDPSRIEDVTEEEILALYEPLPNNEYVKLKDSSALNQYGIEK
ncbi:3-hydroxyisobutyryl-CoA hydrolase, mitochondrial-like [Sitodiplosis mosellana]|uniref:3-hydroxyisobutyryl-CoA hydrolase, mitochondrial-like n=1 Tax=Sitodiplosis mosellana TaxID=263140 RepID=UPI002443FA6D|nr:3-hydroxyisobutyryl-CoA hydrolase, mitochondrial-like [Sitodiplosis mosellana]